MHKDSIQYEICILAGGMSSRMGRDKSKLRIGRRTMLGIIRGEALKLGAPVRVIRKDLVERCGPLGGVVTALRTTKQDAVLFLACDMPMISKDLLLAVLARFNSCSRAVFVESEGAGFPFALHKELLPIVEQQIADQKFSLQNLAKVLHATCVRPTRSQKTQLVNVNTPEDLPAVKPPAK